MNTPMGVFLLGKTNLLKEGNHYFQILVVVEGGNYKEWMGPSIPELFQNIPKLFQIVMK